MLGIFMESLGVNVLAKWAARISAFSIGEYFFPVSVDSGGMLFLFLKTFFVNCQRELVLVFSPSINWLYFSWLYLLIAFLQIFVRWFNSFFSSGIFRVFQSLLVLFLTFISSVILGGSGLLSFLLVSNVLYWESLIVLIIILFNLVIAWLISIGQLRIWNFGIGF